LKVEKRGEEKDKDKDKAETLSAQRQRGEEWFLAPALLKVFQNGNCSYTPGNFRKSGPPRRAGKQRSYRIRRTPNLHRAKIAQQKSADGRMAIEAARLERKNSPREEKEKQS